MYQREKVIQGAFDEKKVLIYDIEVYPPYFSCAYHIVSSNTKGTIEVSTRKNEICKLYKLLENLRDKGWSMVGYNNSEYDWLVLNWIWENQQHLQNLSGGEIASAIYEFNDYYFTYLSKVKGAYFNYKKENNFWVNNYKINQIDLMAIHRLNAMGNMVSLKHLQFNIKSPNITTLPYKPGTMLTPSQMDETLDYNLNNDVEGTYNFYLKSFSEINFRKAMSEELGKNFYSSDDVKISIKYATDYFQNRGVELFYKDENGERSVRQTTYPNGIPLNDIFFEWLELKTECFQAIVKWLKRQVVFDTNGIFSKLPKDTVKEILPYTSKSNIKADTIEKLGVNFGGIDFNFGMGGIHASVENSYIESDDDYIIIDVDAFSYYPKTIILYKIFPDHIGEVFCDFAEEVLEKRSSTAKSDPWYKTYKDILNTFLFGKLWDMNGRSFTLDVQKALKITINNQLTLCMLCEMVILELQNTSLIQANTDGVTFRVYRKELSRFREIIKEFEAISGHIMEESIYDFMAIKGVNDYIAKFSDIEANGKDKGTYKLKGDYGYEGLAWAKDFSTLVIQKAVAAYFRDGIPPEKFIPEHDDPYDFRGRAKVNKLYDLYIFNDANKDNPLFKDISIGARVTFQRILNSKHYNISELLESLYNNDVFFNLISSQIAEHTNASIGSIKIEDILKKLNDNEMFIDYIKTDISKTKKIDYDAVTMKDTNRRYNSIPSRAKFMGEKLSEVYGVKLNMAKALCKGWLDNDKSLTGEFLTKDATIEFISAKLSPKIEVHHNICKQFVKWWLDSDKLLSMDKMKGKKLQPVTAYYMAKKGFYMYKETLPKKDQPLQGMFNAIKSGQKVLPCNNIADFKFDNIDFEWYINEAWKLITPIMPEKDKHLSPIYQAELEKVRLSEEKIRLAIEKKALAAEKKALAAQKKLDALEKKE